MITQLKNILIIQSILFFVCSTSSQARLLRDWDEVDSKAYNFIESKQYSEGIKFAEEALQNAVENYGPKHLSVAKALYWMACFYKEQGNCLKAESLFKNSLAICEQYLESDPDSHIPLIYSHVYDFSLLSLCDIYKSTNEFTKAEAVLRRYIEMHGGLENNSQELFLKELAELYKILGWEKNMLVVEERIKEIQLQDKK